MAVYLYHHISVPCRKNWKCKESKVFVNLLLKSFLRSTHDFRLHLISQENVTGHTYLQRRLGIFFLISRFSRVRLCVTPETAAHQAPPSLGFSRQEHWSGLPFPSPMHESEKWKWSRSVMSNSSRPMDCSLTGSSIHGIFQARVLELAAIAFSTIILLSNNSK